ncbi:hypothetical protein [Streptomyces sp. NPDC005148]
MLVECGTVQQRLRKLPARVVVYLLLKAPHFSALSLMCSYCRSRLRLDPAGITHSIPRTRTLAQAREAAPAPGGIRLPGRRRYSTHTPATPHPPPRHSEWRQRPRAEPAGEEDRRQEGPAEGSPCVGENTRPGRGQEASAIEQDGAVPTGRRAGHRGPLQDEPGPDGGRFTDQKHRGSGRLSDQGPTG